MTRINCIDPSLLRDKHLVAEYRELPRIFGHIRKAQERGESPNDPRNPRQYKLGTGHVRFFYNKAKWLQHRQQALVDELLERNFNIQFTDTSQLIEGIKDEFCGDWKPTKRDQQINIDRINERGGLR